jgi:peptidyl-dipeptidase Dcp
MDNPLLSEWHSSHQLPPFESITPEQFLPAFKTGFKEHNLEIENIVRNPETPSFKNTIEALELTGETLKRVSPVFQILTAANTNDDLIALQTEIIPLQAAHNSAINTRADLFSRVRTVFDAKPSLNPEQTQLLHETYNSMLRAGAGLSQQDADTVQKIDSKLATLQTQYGQNVLKDSNDFELVIEEKDLDGLPKSVCESASAGAEDRGYAGKFLFTISRSSFTPFLQYSTRRDLRERLWNAYTHCANNNNEFDNKDLAKNIARLRAERAKLLGHTSHAAYMLADRMAETPKNVKILLDKLWLPTKEKAKKELDSLQNCVQDEGGNFKIAAWDWWYYTEKVRQQKFDFDSEKVKPYFELTQVRQGAFDVATKLFGITFIQIPNEARYHEDVETFEVREDDESLIGLFITDYFMRPSKRSGAWMNALRSQKTFGSIQYPVVFNTCNFPKASPALLGMEEVTTLFHEFGHALHGLLSKVNYERLSGTSVKRDFVELPSQIMEHWAVEPQVLKEYAKHYISNEVIPDHFIEKIQETRTFNQGFKTSEYLAASYLDLDWHELEHQDEEQDTSELEKESMRSISLLKEIAPRYRSTYFQHIFSGGYSAGYYSYIWAEVLDADAYEEFKKNGVFDKNTASSFRTHILEKGGTADPMALYRNFKGAEPDIGPLMEARGLL